MGPSLLKEEINQAIKEMKRGKAKGIGAASISKVGGAQVVLTHPAQQKRSRIDR
jgi:hypothetical protein